MPKCKKSDYILSGKVVGEMVGGGKILGELHIIPFRFLIVLLIVGHYLPEFNQSALQFNILCHIR